MSYRPLARIAGLSLAGVLLLGCDVTDTPNRTGQRWLEETGVTLPEPFTITVPIEVDSLGAESQDSRVLPVGGAEHYAGAFAGQKAEWRAVFRPAHDSDWRPLAVEDSAANAPILRGQRANEGAWSLLLVVDPFPSKGYGGVKLRLSFFPDLPVGGVYRQSIDSLMRFAPLSAAGADTVVNFVPDSTDTMRIALPQPWIERLRAMRGDGTKVAAFSLTPVDDSGMVRIYSQPLLRIAQTIAGKPVFDDLRTSLTSLPGTPGAFATRIVMPSLAKDEPVLFAGPRRRDLRVRIDTAKFRAAVRAALPAVYRDDPRFSDPFAAGFLRYSVLGAHLTVNIESTISEDGLLHPVSLSSRADDVLEASEQEIVLEPGDTVAWSARGPIGMAGSTGSQADTIWTSSLVRRGHELLVIVRDLSSNPAKVDTVAFDEDDTGVQQRSMFQRLLLLQREGEAVRLRDLAPSLDEALDPQSDSLRYRLASLVGPGRTSVELRARIAFSRMFANPGRNISLELGIEPFAFDPSRGINDLNRKNLSLGFYKSFTRSRLAGKPLGNAVIVLQPLGSKGRK